MKSIIIVSLFILTLFLTSCNSINIQEGCTQYEYGTHKQAECMVMFNSELEKANKFAETEDCHLVSKGIARDSCEARYVALNGDCNTIQGASKKNSCFLDMLEIYKNKAIKEQNIEWCVKIQNTPQFDESTEIVKSTCFIDYALEFNDVDACSKIESKYNERNDVCVMKLVQRTNNKNYCQYIDLENTKVDMIKQYDIC